MGLFAFIVSLYFLVILSAAASLHGIPPTTSPPSDVIGISATATLNPAIASTASTDRVLSFPADVGNYDYAAQTALDVTLFRKVYSDRLSLRENYSNARDIAISCMKQAARRFATFLKSLDHVTIGNIVLRSAVRSLTPGFELGFADTGGWGKVADDVVAAIYAADARPVLELPAVPSGDLDIVLPSRLLTLDEVERGVKWTLARSDVSSLISLGLGVVVSVFDLELVDTSSVMALIDDFLHVVCRSHEPPFHRLGDVVQSIDTAFPSLELPPLLADLPRTLTLDAVDPAGNNNDNPFDFELRRRIRYTRPTPVEKEPTVIHATTSPMAGFENPTNQRTGSSKGLSSYVIMEDSNQSLLRDILGIFVSFFAGGGVAFVAGKRMVDARLKAEQARQDSIRFQISKSLSYLPWKRRMQVLKKISRIKTTNSVVLEPGFKLAINARRSEDQIAAHVIQLVRALVPTRRKELIRLLELASTLAPPSADSTVPDPPPDAGRSDCDVANTRSPLPPATTTAAATTAPSFPTPLETNPVAAVPDV